MADRTYDIVLFGATGFTGELTADYLSRHVPAGCRWALAGRNRGKLEAVRSRLAAVDAGLAKLPLLLADVTDAESLRAVAEASRVVISTVGPYIIHGEPLVAACATAGTDYVDLTGEQEFVDLMYARHHETAVRTGARLVHCCGFDSIPHDLGVYFTVGQLREDVPITVDGVVRAGGMPSGGTLRSVVAALSRQRNGATAGQARRALERSQPGQGARRSQAVATRPRREDGLWLLPLPTIDPQIVARSGRVLPRYGPDFTYHHYVGVRRLPIAVATALGVTALAGVVKVRSARELLLRRIPESSGPSPERRAKGWFTVRFTATGGGQRVVTEVSGGDPGYGETSKMLAESALSLAFDELPDTAGQVTTAVAMGDALTGRLTAAGLTFRTVRAGPADR